jgi:hypothetical protein
LNCSGATDGAIQHCRRGHPRAGSCDRAVGDHRPERYEHGAGSRADRREGAHGLPDLGRDLAARAASVPALLLHGLLRR